MSRTSFLIPLMVLVAGCGDTKPLTVAPDHPANPDAAAAPLAPPSATLALTTAPTTSPASPGRNPDAPARYTCPHHPGVASDEPGECPECGVTLVREGGVP